ncbi:MAG: UDP-2,3-diacylglucosamine diphosphatase LpxI, partial [Alphaproteobacteria bacterium]
GGVLVKLKKIQQERRADLPTIGTDTVRHTAEAGLNGIAVEAGQSLILDRAEVVAEANRLGLYVAGIKA